MANHELPSRKETDTACIEFSSDYLYSDSFHRNKTSKEAVMWLGAWRDALGYYPSPFGLGKDFSTPGWHAIDEACHARWRGWRELGSYEAKPVKIEAVKWLSAWRKAFSGKADTIIDDMYCQHGHLLSVKRNPNPYGLWDNLSRPAMYGESKHCERCRKDEIGRREYEAMERIANRLAE